jgi:hypothetical protein
MVINYGEGVGGEISQSVFSGSGKTLFLSIVFMIISFTQQLFVERPLAASCC